MKNQQNKKNHEKLEHVHHIQRAYFRHTNNVVKRKHYKNKKYLEEITFFSEETHLNRL